MESTRPVHVMMAGARGATTQSKEPCFNYNEGLLGGRGCRYGIDKCRFQHVRIPDYVPRKDRPPSGRAPKGGRSSPASPSECLECGSKDHDIYKCPVYTRAKRHGALPLRVFTYVD